MEPWVKPITIKRGDTKELFFRVRTKVWDETLQKWVAGDYKDLTGYTIAGQVRQTKQSTTVLLTFTITLGNQADLVAGRGAVLAKIGSGDTATVPFNITEGVYDFQFTEPDADVFTYIEGPVTFTEDVTRA